MCDFFSCWATRDGRLLFCEDNSHDETARRAHLRDSNGHAVKIEVTPDGDGWGPVRVDEPTTPGWWTEDHAAWEGRVLALADRVRSARATYIKTVAPARAIRDKAVPAWATYDEATATARATYYKMAATAQATFVAALRTIDGYVADAEREKGQP